MKITNALLIIATCTSLVACAKSGGPGVLVDHHVTIANKTSSNRSITYCQDLNQPELDEAMMYSNNVLDFSQFRTDGEVSIPPRFPWVLQPVYLSKESQHYFKLCKLRTTYQLLSQNAQCPEDTEYEVTETCNAEEEQ